MFLLFFVVSMIQFLFACLRFVQGLNLGYLLILYLCLLMLHLLLLGWTWLVCLIGLLQREHSSVQQVVLLPPLTHFVVVLVVGYDFWHCHALIVYCTLPKIAFKVYPCFVMYNLVVPFFHIIIIYANTFTLTYACTNNSALFISILPLADISYISTILLK